MSRPRAADDFATIRARMEELRRERQGEPPPAEAMPGLAEGRRPSIVRRMSDMERLRRARVEGLPPHWVPTIFVRKSRA